jgi:type IV pilus assembly protein PilN
MTKINLLPWREELRKERMNRFIAMAVMVAFLGAAVVAAVHVYNAAMISNQVSRNQTLEKEIAQLNRQIKEIEALETTRANLESRMEVIQRLQAGRPGIVFLFDEFVRTVPDGLYLELLQQAGEVFTIKGYAQSNARVSEYMLNLNGSDWMTNSKLEMISAGSGNRSRERQFSLTVTHVNPNLKKEEEKK